MIDTFIQRLPSWVHPYVYLARLDKPIGILLLLAPCWWGLALSGDKNPFSYFIFLVGAVLMRGAGCTYNDWLDRKIDAEVARTRLRPLAQGLISSRNALYFALMQTVCAGFLLFWFNLYAIVLSFCALALALLYPLMKRITYWPQLFLGLTFNSGVLIASAFVLNKIPYEAWCMYGVGILWTLCYDTVYAFQDIEDDLRIGVKSTPIFLGVFAKPFLYLCVLGMGGLLIMVGRKGYGSWYGLNAFVTLMVLSYRIYRLSLCNKKECANFFRHQVDVGVSLWIGFL